jgi:hypothetical protein
MFKHNQIYPLLIGIRLWFEYSLYACSCENREKTFFLVWRFCISKMASASRILEDVFAYAQNGFCRTRFVYLLEPLLKEPVLNDMFRSIYKIYYRIT